MKKSENKPKVKPYVVICTVLTVIIAVLAAIILIDVIVSKAKNKPVNFFGISFSIVATQSMEPEILQGELIIIRKCNFDDIEVGNNVVFIADENFSESIRGQSVVHKVVRITEEGLVTKGVNKKSKEDGGFRTPETVIGICTAHSLAWGKIFKFLGKYGIILILLCVALPFIIGQIIKIIKLSKEKDEVTETQVSSIQSETLPEILQDKTSAGDDSDENVTK